MRWTALVTAGLLAASSAGAAEAPWATRDQYGAFQIVVAADASGSERAGAAILQRYWQAVTGHELAIVDDAFDGPAIYVGFGSVPEAYLEGVDPARFGYQELWLKSLNDKGQPKLIIAGGAELGTKYAVYQFLEDRLGIRWLAPGVTHVPPAPDAIAAIDYRYEPVFEYRWSTYLNNIDDRAALDEFRDAHRWLAGPSFSCHSFYRYVPPEVYFKDHPEYYSLVNGKRVAPTYDWRVHNEHRNHPGEQGQLCMTNPDVLDVIFTSIEAEIAANPGNKVHHVSQMDWNYWCECENCRAIDTREESHMGSVLWGLNQIAERLAVDHPDHRIETLAYTYTRKPPKTLRPHGNVIIKLCSIECDFSRPFSDPDSMLNRTFADDIEQWSAIASRLHCWDYLTNFNNFQSPMPNFHIIQPNMQFLAEHHVKGMFPQGAYDDVAEFAPLRTYVLSTMMWNPYCDVQTVMDEFINLYYREAGPFVKEYIELLTKRQQHPPQSPINGGNTEALPLTCFDQGMWYDYDTVEQARALFDRAFAAVQSDEIRRRLDIVYTTVQYAAFKCPPNVEIADDTITIRRPESQTFDEYYAMLQRYNIKNINDFLDLNSFVEQTRGQTPPRHRESPLVKLENDRCLAWIAPELDGSIIRWYDKQHKLELLRGFQGYGTVPGTWEDWSTAPGMVQRPVADRYDVLNRTDTSVTLRARLDSGAVVERTLTLTDDAVAVALTFINESDGPLRPNLKVHPEFFTQGLQRPEIWGEKAGQWTDLTKDVRPEEIAYGTIVPADGVTRLAAYLPAASASLVCTIGSDSIKDLLYFFNINPEAQHVNLELLPDTRATLQPGERIELRGSYGVKRGRPEQL